MEEFDLDGAMASISSDMGFESSNEKDDDKDIFADDADDGHEPESVDSDDTTDDTTDDVAPDVETKAVKPAPKSWQKERHESWGKIDAETQDYIELREKQMLDGLEQYKNDASYGKAMLSAVTPYKAMLSAQGLNETQAVQTLLNAHYRLSNGGASDKASYFSQLAQHYGIDLGGMGADSGYSGQEGRTAIDPAVKLLQDKVEQMQGFIESGRREAQQATSNKTAEAVNAFADDAAHPYFDEVADDIVAMIKTGADLNSAYEKAVWANPITRQKEILRIQTENETNLRAKLKEETAAAKKATSTNINARETKRTPTEPTGTMQNLDGSLRDTLRAMKARSNNSH